MANELTASVFLIVSIHIKQAEELDRYECTKSSWAVSWTPFPVLVSIKRIWNTPSYIDKSVHSKRVIFATCSFHPFTHQTITAHSKFAQNVCFCLKTVKKKNLPRLRFAHWGYIGGEFCPVYRGTCNVLLFLCSLHFQRLTIYGCVWLEHSIDDVISNILLLLFLPFVLDVLLYCLLMGSTGL